MNDRVSQYVTRTRTSLMLGIPEEELDRTSMESELGRVEHAATRKRRTSLATNYSGLAWSQLTKHRAS